MRERERVRDREREDLRSPGGVGKRKEQEKRVESTYSDI